MAENNEYKLTITLEGGSNEDNTAVAPTPNGQENSKQSAKDKNGKNKNGISTMVAVGYALNIADKLISNQINTITLRTGFEEQQSKYQFYYNGMKRLASVGTSVVSGFLLSGGNSVGAAIGLTMGMVNQAIDTTQTVNRVQIARENENTQIFLNTVRMGAGANRGNRE